MNYYLINNISFDFNNLNNPNNDYIKINKKNL